MLAYQVSVCEEEAQLCDMPQPVPGSTQALVEILACGLNFADLLMQKGTYQDMPTPPFTLGMEVAGIVRESGALVDTVKPGDRVMSVVPQGGLAQFGAFDADRLTALPDGMTFAQAASFQIGYASALVALQHRARLEAGETLLVTGAGGGTGLTAVEVGAQMSARVIAAARGASKLEAARAAGAVETIDTAKDDLRDAMRALGGADVVYDTVGGDTFRAAFRAANPEARLLPIGFAGGEVPQIPANHLLVKNLTVIGFYIGGYQRFRPVVFRNAMATLLTWFEEGRLTPRVGHTLPLTQVAEGMALLRDRKAVGKVVIEP